MLIIDETHHLRNEVLEDLRLLTNFEMDSHNRLCLLFVALTKLRRRLQMAVHESLEQRIVMRFHLGALNRDELDTYIEHRLRGADCQIKLFEPPTTEAIFQASQALPREVNRLAHYALTACAAAAQRSVGAEHVHIALSDASA